MLRACLAKNNPEIHKLDANGKIASLLEVKADVWAAYVTEDDLFVFKAIQRPEIVNFGWKEDVIRFSRRVYEFVRRYKALYFWVHNEVLAKPTPSNRAKHITHFIKIAKSLYKRGNIFSQTAIIAALCDESIKRLNLTWKLIEKKHLHRFKNMKEFISDHTEMQKYLAEDPMPCIPPLGFYRLDLLFNCELNNSPKSQTETAFIKDLKLDKIIKKITYFQASFYGFPNENEIIWHYLSFIDYDISMQISLKRKYARISEQLEPDTTYSPECYCTADQTFIKRRSPIEIKEDLKSAGDVRKQIVRSTSVKHNDMEKFTENMKSDIEVYKIAKQKSCYTRTKMSDNCESFLENKEAGSEVFGDMKQKFHYLSAKVDNDYESNSESSETETLWAMVTSIPVLSKELNNTIVECHCCRVKSPENKEIGEYMSNIKGPFLEGKFKVTIITRYIHKNIPTQHVKKCCWVSTKNGRLYVRESKPFTKKKADIQFKSFPAYIFVLSECFIGRENDLTFKIEAATSRKYFLFKAASKDEVDNWMKVLQMQLLPSSC